MDNSVTIITIKDYGKVDICLKQLLEERGLTRYYLVKTTNTRFEVIKKGIPTKLRG